MTITSQFLDLTAVREGSIVWALVDNHCEDPNSTGKRRPVVMVRSHGAGIIAACMTSRGTFQSTGGSRSSVPYSSGLGLNGPGFFWSNKLEWLREESILAYAGHANLELIEVILERFVDLRNADIEALLRISGSLAFVPEYLTQLTDRPR